MAYQLRFESNAFRADSAIGRLLDGLSALSRNARRFAGAQITEYEGNELRQLRGINGRTFERAMDWADADFDQQMTSEKWDWPNETRRKNGQVVNSPRDIIDTGALLQSKRREQIGNSVVEFIWDDEVAEGVHDGMVSKSNKRLPARPWTEPTLDEIEGIIESMLRQGGRR
jgi:hypothetical protein